MSDRLLKVAEVAERLGVTERFVRRLIAERRIEYVKAGTHVRIKENALTVYIDESTVEPIHMGLHSNGLVA